MTSPLLLLRRLSRPLDPLPTGVNPRLVPLEGVRGVVFDVYGTLVVSASGDIGVSDAPQKEAALRSILRDLAVNPPPGDGLLTDRLTALIKNDHLRARAAGIDYPEVEIRDIWRSLLGLDDDDLVNAVAVAYEAVTNPVWPMPAAAGLLAGLRARRFLLGIVSNAQFYTPLLFDALFGASLDRLGFDPGLSFFSYQHRRAKPGLWLFQQLREALPARQLDPSAILYVGNDALKDIHPAASLGFRTALFAGDQRSYRPRPETPGLLPPDAILTRLSQIPQLIN